MISVELIPAFDDNYIFIIINSDSSEAIVIDPGDAIPVRKFLDAKNLRLKAVLTTHHHADHVGGVPELREIYKVPVWAPLKNKNQISADTYVSAGDEISVAGQSFLVIDLPGHTLGHIAYWLTAQNWLFSGDVLFGLGCGRLFEGDFEQGFESLQKIKALSGNTLVFCAHEYTERNLEFCKTLPLGIGPPAIAEYEKSLKNLRSQGLPSVPLSLATEKLCNPFLLASTKEEFSFIRELRNRF